jgi:adenine-specific DNA-methyltransferase
MVEIPSRSALQQYHTESEQLVAYMTDRLSAEAGQSVLEPSAGTGLLVKATLEKYPGVVVEACEVDAGLARGMTLKFDSRVRVREVDYIDLPGDREYDRIIANPPYGGWLTPERRERLQVAYPGLYVKETYGLFMYHALQSLKPGGRAVFIVPETFLYLHRHDHLRRALFTRTRIIDLVVFPSRFFPGIGMAYANLCIITFEREDVAESCRRNVFSARYGLVRPDDLNRSSSGTVISICQSQVVDGLGSALLLSDSSAVVNLINESEQRLGGAADCVTGFYSGNDLEFLRCADSAARNSNRYEPLCRAQAAVSVPQYDEMTNGIANSRRFVPIRKGGPDRYVARTQWYMDWSVEAVAGYRKSKKARLQNTRFYFKRGIAVPMVSSTGIRASIMDEELFDQAIVGVFPHDSKDFLYLLGLLNSPTASTIIKTINPTANNSANYIKKIPLIEPLPAVRARVETIVSEIVSHVSSGAPFPDHLMLAVDELISATYGF